MELPQKADPRPTIISLLQYPKKRLPTANTSNGIPIGEIGFVSWMWITHCLKELLLFMKVKYTSLYE